MVALIKPWSGSIDRKLLAGRGQGRGHHQVAADAAQQSVQPRRGDRRDVPLLDW